MPSWTHYSDGCSGNNPSTAGEVFCEVIFVAVIAAPAAPEIVGGASATCMRFADWCTRLAGAGAAGANAVNETFAPGSGSPAGISDDAWRYATASNKFSHYFQEGHDFGPLVAQLGSEEAVLHAILLEVQLKAPQSGVFTRLNVNVLGHTVETSGFVDNGVVKLGDMWIL